MNTAIRRLDKITGQMPSSYGPGSRSLIFWRRDRKLDSAYVMKTNDKGNITREITKEFRSLANTKSERAEVAKVTG